MPVTFMRSIKYGSTSETLQINAKITSVFPSNAPLKTMGRRRRSVIDAVKKYTSFVKADISALGTLPSL